MIEKSSHFHSIESKRQHMCGLQSLRDCDPLSHIIALNSIEVTVGGCCSIQRGVYVSVPIFLITRSIDDSSTTR